MANQAGDQDGGGSGGGGGDSGDQYLAEIQNLIPGIPSILASQAAEILRNNPGDDGIQRMFDWLRGTDWFNTAYAGFNQGVGSGLWGASYTDLVSYRTWQNGITQSYSQYYGRTWTVAELMDFASKGYSAGTVDQMGQGHSTAVANSADWNYYSGAFDTGQFTEADKQAYGELLAGRSSDLGLKIQARLQAAMQRAQSLFQGTLASGGQGPQAGFAPALSGSPTKTDIGA